MNARPAAMPKVVADRLDIRQNALARYMTLSGHSAQEVGTAINELIANCSLAQFSHDSDKGAVYVAVGIKCGGKVVEKLEITVKGNQIIYVGSGLKELEPSVVPAAQSTPSPEKFVQT